MIKYKTYTVIDSERICDGHKEKVKILLEKSEKVIFRMYVPKKLSSLALQIEIKKKSYTHCILLLLKK